MKNDGVLSHPILFDNLGHGPAVYFKFPPGIVPELKFKHPDTGCLTTEFWYTEDGNISYDERTAGQVCQYAREPFPEDTASSQILPLASEQPWKYAQFVTVSSTYEEVAMTLFMTALSISTVMTQMFLAYRCVFKVLQHRELNDWVDWVFAIYPLLVLLKLITWASISFWDATNRMRTKTAVVGDLVKDMNARDRIWTTVYTIFFHMFSVPTSVTDSPVNLHIRKPVQPYVAFKSQGHRAWILGWPSKEQFKVVTQDRGIPNLIVGATFDLPLIITQVILKLKITFGHELDMFMAGLFSTACFFYRLSKLVKLVQYKRRLYHRLRDLTSKSVAEAEQEGEQSLKELIVNHRLLEDHCYTKMPSDVFEKAAEMGFGDQKLASEYRV